MEDKFKCQIKPTCYISKPKQLFIMHNIHNSYTSAITLNTKYKTTYTVTLITT